ncbi:MAG: adenine deaminase [Clostridiaceae bacterium]|nr:adenine deaminase [Eubacteriales bacterium]
MKQHELIQAALEGRATYAIKNARVVNVFTGEILEADVAVYEDTIVGVGRFDAEREYDAKGAYLCPGFIDSHVHIESSMVIPPSYARVIMPHGTTGIIADPHEIANVAGVEGVRAMYKFSEGLPLRVYFMMPSCVPATKFETSGAEILAEDMAAFSKKSRILGLGEVMDYTSTIHGDKDMLDKIRLFEGRPIDGHAPLVSGRELNAYRIAGPSTDHECSNYDEVLEKLRTGMRIMLRVGSAAKGMDDIFRKIAQNKLPTENMTFCTDDKHIENIRAEGHINCIARLAVSCGISPVDAVKMSSYNAARIYGLKRAGAVAVGYRADMVLFRDLESFEVVQVFTGGEPYVDREFPYPPIPKEVFGSVRMAPLTADSFKLKTDTDVMPVIRMVEEQLVTELVYRKARVENGAFRPDETLTKLAVIDRHHATGRMALGIVEGLGIVNGAIASTVAHDSHNLVVAGDNDADMLMAADSLRDCGGGYSVVSRGVVIARLPLPVAGLMTDAPIDGVVERQRALLDAAYSLGAKKGSDPLIALSFLALPVIPEVRLTDKGLFDVAKMKFI